MDQFALYKELIWSVWERMVQDIFLIAPADAEAKAFPAQLAAALAAAPVAALLVPQGEKDDAAYRTLVTALLPLTQPANCALLLDNRPDLVRPLGADGVHMTGGAGSLREALAALKPDFIVGSGNIGSRHEAMTRGELEIDYLLFDDAEMAQWWAQTFEVPSVYRASRATDPEIAHMSTEFIGLGDRIWDEPQALAVLGKQPA